jgi:hypothetical protein
MPERGHQQMAVDIRVFIHNDHCPFSLKKQQPLCRGSRIIGAKDAPLLFVIV